MRWWKVLLVLYYRRDFGLHEARRLARLPLRRRWRRVTRLLYGPPEVRLNCLEEECQTLVQEAAELPEELAGVPELRDDIGQLLADASAADAAERALLLSRFTVLRRRLRTVEEAIGRRPMPGVVDPLAPAADVRKRVGDLETAARMMTQINGIACRAYERAKAAEERLGTCSGGPKAARLRRGAERAKLEFFAAREQARWLDAFLQQYVECVRVARLVDDLGRLVDRRSVKEGREPPRPPNEGHGNVSGTDANG